MKSVRVRATLAATLVVAVALGIAALVLVSALRGSLKDSADAEAARRAVEAAPMLLRGYKETEKFQRADDVTSAKPLQYPDVMVGAKETSAEFAPPGEFASAKLTVTTTTGGLATVYGRASLAPAQEALDTLNQALLPGIPALIVLVAGVTWFSVGRTLAPVASIRAKLAHITGRDLHQRVPVPESRDEVAALATTVNGTLDRLETAVETHKRFVADAAHELRSPIATLRARMELADPSDLTREALADIDRLQSLAADLLLLARLDAGEPVEKADLDVSQVAAEETLRLRQAKQTDVHVELDVQPDVVIQGSRGHLGRLVTNLVDNAVRHAAGTVEVRVRRVNGDAVLEVLDDGPGIPPEDREAVFDRFTRLDEARARDGGGAGLGLPIARDIALLHGGTLKAQDGGFIAKFPVNQEAGAIRVNG